ncbi:LacI family DNA-binding transcriptional regulator [Leeia sp. TBRC 13508]|uniref:LacI family DNA-binding transcriptional regulator n=1 Tax=Leeia speluncae TaxID=2884804 RepID=A0ABS8DA32_9NEIS|nr:LacI family DNA-binding transcriptional regulator [Leeia speluncae]MCB6185062.1 LacI family DNA-binding transcriptional regulator [Leeia speluncae]
MDSKRRKRAPRLQEIALEAGVSETTVDRVLNERGSVSSDTRAKVVAAAKKLGVSRILPDIRHGLIRIEVLLPVAKSHFLQRLHQSLQRYAQMLDERIIVQRTVIPEENTENYVQHILYPKFRRNGLIVVARFNEEIKNALAQVMKRGETVVTLMSDFPGIEQHHYAGIDNYSAGETAGYLIGKLSRQQGEVFLLTNNLTYKAHVDRTSGFANMLKKQFHHLTFNEQPMEHFDNVDNVYLCLQRHLKSHPNPENVVAIYNSGAGSAGIEAAIRKYLPNNDLIWVAHEATDEHKKLMEEGLLNFVLDQDPDGQASSALQHVLHANKVIETKQLMSPIDFKLYCAANLWKTDYFNK